MKVAHVTRELVAAALVAQLLVGCSPSESRRSSGSSSTSVPTNGSGVNPYVIPDVITPAYVNAVFVVLNQINGDVLRLLVTERAITPGVEEDLAAIYSPPLYRYQLATARNSLSGAINNVKPNPGDPVTVVIRLIYSSKQCIFVQVDNDLSQVLIKPVPEPVAEYYGLKYKGGMDSTDRLNPTPWIIFNDVALLRPRPVQDPCISQ